MSAAGMSYVLLGAMLLVSGISGSKTADMAAVAPVLFPEMRKRGMKDGELVSLLAASGAMSETIPPSIVLIAIASVTGVSIAALFTAGILPGHRAGARARRSSRATAPAQEEDAALKVRARADVGGRRKTFVVALPALAAAVPDPQRGGRGLSRPRPRSRPSASPTRSCSACSSIAAAWTGSAVLPMLVQTASLSGAILFIVGAASAMAWALTQSGFSHDLAAQHGRRARAAPSGFLLISIVAFIVLGSVLEGIPAIVLFGPLLFPVAQQLGINEVHYAMVVILAMGLGLFAPPFGLCYYAACIIGDVSPEAGLSGSGSISPGCSSACC